MDAPTTEQMVQGGIVVLWGVVTVTFLAGALHHERRVRYYQRFLAYVRARGVPGDVTTAEQWCRDEWRRFGHKGLLVAIALLNGAMAGQRAMLPRRTAGLELPSLLEILFFVGLALFMVRWTEQVDRDRAPLLARTRAPIAAAAPETPTERTALVYVVDDVWAVREYVTQVLERAGHSVVAFQSSGPLLVALAARVPDVLLLDVVLGRESGIAVAQQVRAQWPTLPIYLVTGWAADSRDSEVRALLAEAGADGALAKPLRREALLALVATVLAVQGVEAS